MDYDDQIAINEELRQQAKTGSFEKVIELIDKGGEVSSMDETGKTALHFAIERDESRLVHALIENGADVNVDSDAATKTPPIALAAEQGSLKIVKMLLRAKADPYVRGEDGLDALDHAQQFDGANRDKIVDAITREKPPKKNRKMR